MKSESRNIYKRSRENADISQEYAAEHLPISIRQLSDYENDRCKSGVPDEIVAIMMKLYKDKYLGYLHLRKNPVGMILLPDISEVDLAKCVLKMQKEIKDVQDINADIVNIACDGKIDNSEQKLWKSVGKEVFEMAGAALAVSYSK